MRTARGIAASALVLAVWVFGFPARAADSPARLDDSWMHRSLQNRLFFYAGGDVATDSAFAWSGILAAPSGTLHEDGWRLRLAGGTGRYRYRTSAVPGGVNVADVVSGEVMAGYRFTYAEAVASVFLGGHIENQQLHVPDPGHQSQGLSAGVKGLVELYRRFTPAVVGTASASASTVNRAYHLRATLSYGRPSGFTIGTEAALLGDLRYTEPRAGLFVQSTYGRTTLSLAGGWLSNSDKGEGAYATLAAHSFY